MMKISISTLLSIWIIFSFSTNCFANEGIPLPVKNASFEDSADYAQTIEFRNEGGSIAVAEIDSSLAATGKRSLRIIRTNALGRATVTWKEVFPARPGLPYEVSIDIHLKEATYGGICTLKVVELDKNGKNIKTHVPGWHFQIPVFNKPGKFMKHRVNFTTDKETTGLQVNYILSGNPLTANLDDISITEGAKIVRVPGIKKPGDPLPEREDVLKTLENIKPREAWVERRNDKPTLIVNGRPVPLVLHVGTDHFSSFAKAGVHIHVTNLWKGADLYWDLNPHISQEQCHKGNEIFDFSKLENELFRIANADPEAMVVVRIWVNPDPEWCEAHPDSIFQTGNEKKGIIKASHNVVRLVDDISERKLDEWWAFSYASQDYQEYVCEGLKALAQFLKESPAGKIVIGIMPAGGNDAQFLPFVHGSTLDYSPSAQKSFRGWLREKYGNNKTLQKAWGNADVTLDTAEFAPPSLISSKHMFFSSEGLDRQAVDTNEFASVATARMLRRFMGTFKEEFERPVIGLTYYSDMLWPHLNRLSTNELLGGPEVDAVISVPGYAPWRQPGSTGMASNFCVASASLRNKLHITELDYRTWLSDRSNPDAVGMARDADEFNAAIRRDAGLALSRGGGFWFCDISNGWYEDPSLMATVAESFKMANWVTANPRKIKPQMAIFVDERSGFHTSNRSLQFWSYFLGQTAWNASGIPADIYLLSDIVRNDIPDYNFYLIASPLTLSKSKAEAIIKKTRRAGKVLMIAGPMAVAGETGVKDTTDLLGMTIKQGAGTRRQVMLRDDSVKHPLVNNVYGIIGQAEMLYCGGSMPNTYWYYVDDPQAIIMGRWAESGEPALAVKSTSKGTVIFSASAGGYTPQLLHNAARMAGITPVSRPGNATYLGYGIAVSHRMSALPVTIDFDKPVYKFSAGGRKKMLKKWAPETEACRTALMFYRYPQGGKNE